jgi:hypothetical protein
MELEQTFKLKKKKKIQRSCYSALPQKLESEESGGDGAF